MELTLLERWDDSHTEAMQWAPDAIRRAIAIAQAVEENKRGWPNLVGRIMRRAHELLGGEK